MYSVWVSWGVYALPVTMVFLIGVSLIVREIRTFRSGGSSPFLLLPCATFSLLVLLLNERSRTEDGFITLVVMCLLLAGLFWFLIFRRELVSDGPRR